jgi:glycosyltransferase involved in cell wall biosynthesis
MNMLQPDRTAGGAVPLNAQPTPLEIRHVVFDVRDAHALNANGQFRVARQLASEQRAAGETSKVYFLRLDGRVVPEDSTDAFKLLPMQGLQLAGHHITIADSVIREMTASDNAPLFLHLHAGRQPFLPWLTWRLRRMGIPYAITPHGRYAHIYDAEDRAQYPRANYPRTALYLKHLERHALEGAQFVHAVSVDERALIERVAPRARVELIDNAAYSRRLDGEPKPIPRSGPSANYPRFGFLGRFEIEHKGLDLLLDGFAKYRELGGRGTLDLGGTGPSRDRLAEQAKTLGITPFVSIFGPHFGAERVRLFTGWDYFVMPSRFEGVPLGGIEAALMGLPLIVSKGSGLRAKVEEFGGGIGIQALTPEAIAQAFLQADGKAESWTSMSTAAWRMALSFGDWTTTAAALAKKYRETRRVDTAAASRR